jgi:hypothetical protein
MQIEIIKYKPEAPITLEDFANSHGLTMVVTERDPYFWNTSGHFYAHFRSAETKKNKTDKFLACSSGNGRNPEEAIENYKREIEGKILILNATSRARKEIQVPDELK